MRQEILESQPQLLAKFLKGMKSKDGTTLEDKFEDFQRRSFVAHQRRDSGPGYERWKDRSLEMQRKIDAAKLSNQVAATTRQHEGPQR